MRIRHRVAFILLLAAATLPCQAGIRYTAISRTETTGAEAGYNEVKVRGQVSGNRAKVEFVESNNPLMPAGSYLLSDDAGKTMTLVDPARQRYARFDVFADMKATGDKRDVGPIKIKYRAAKFEQLLDEDGGIVAGLPTRHYRFHTSYAWTMQMPGGLGSTDLSMDMTEDIWVAPKLAADPALAAWLKKEPVVTGYAELDQIIRTESQKVQGFALKHQTLSKINDSKEYVSIIRDMMEVTDLRSENVPESTFAVPAGYKEYRQPEAPEILGPPIQKP